MTSPLEFSKIKELVTIIKNNSPIAKVPLVVQSGLSISYYEKLKPYMESVSKKQVQWRKKEKLWYYIEPKDRS